jgi:hypothetical protein
MLRGVVYKNDFMVKPKTPSNNEKKNAVFCPLNVIQLLILKGINLCAERDRE